MTEKSDAGNPSDKQPETGPEAAGPAHIGKREGVIEYREMSQDYVLTAAGEAVQMSDSRKVLEDYAEENGITIKSSKSDHA